MQDDELMLELYKIQIARSEHYESQRATIGNTVLVVAAALISLTTIGDSISRVDALNGVALIMCGAFGCVASRLHSHRARRHGKRAGKYRSMLNRLRSSSDCKAEGGRPRNSKTYLYRVWEAVHALVALIGMIVVIAALA